jgi:putative peptide zinc metalloprotease protein
VPAPRPRLAPGAELIGEVPDSALDRPRYLLRLADGRMVQLSQILYLVAERADGTTELAEIAAGVSQALGRRVSAEQIEFLVEEKLRPAGVVSDALGHVAVAERPRPALALQFRSAVVPAGTVGSVAAVLRPLFRPLVVALVVAGLAAADIWLFAVHGLGEAAQQLVFEPQLFLLVFAILAVSTAFHECGHAAGCAYGGAAPGAMGVGLYVAWPTFYVDVTDAYRLGRAGRLRTDLGGVYFNAMVVLLVVAVYLLTGFEPLLGFVLLQQVEMLIQFVPWLRLDGYYVVSDLLGLPDLFSRIRPVLSSFVPGRSGGRRATELPARARAAIGVWVATMIVIPGAVLLVLLRNIELIYEVVSTTVLLQVVRLLRAFDAGDPLAAGEAVVQVAIVALAGAAMVLTLGAFVLRTVRASGRRLAAALRPRVAASEGRS